MTNTNCLENTRCPDCGQTEQFQVLATSIFDIFDNGTDNHQDVIYDDASAASCPACNWEGTWGDLEAKQPDFLDDHLEIVGLSDEAAEKIKDRIRREF